MALGRRSSFFRTRAGNSDANSKAIIGALRALGHFVVPIRSSDPGVADLLVFPMAWNVPRSVALAWPPVFLELKVAKGKLLKSQVEWRASAEARGIRVVTVRSVDEALEALK